MRIRILVLAAALIAPLNGAAAQGNPLDDCTNRHGNYLSTCQAIIDEVTRLPRPDLMDLVRRAGAYGGLGRFEEALADMDKVVALSLSISFVYGLRSMVKSGMPGRFDDAMADIDRAIAMDPTVAQFYFIRGGLQVFHGEQSRGLADLDEAFARNPRDAATTLLRGVALSALGRHREANTALDLAVELQPGLAEIYWRRGFIRFERGDLPGAMADAEAALSIDPGLAMAYQLQSQIWCLRADLARALSDNQKALDLAKTTAQRILFLGWRAGYRLETDAAAAHADCEAILAVDTTGDLGLGCRASVRLLTGDGAGARKDLDDAIKASPSATLLMLRSVIRFYDGSDAAALEDADAAARKEVANEGLLLWRGLLLQRMGRPDGLARTMLDIEVSQPSARIIRMLLREDTPQSVLDAAAADPEQSRAATCTASFYAGQLALLRSDAPEAIRLFQLGDRTCGQSLLGFAAREELKRLAATTTAPPP